MTNLFGVLDISRRALGTNQSGVRTASHNIANVDTPGYSRQRQVLEASLPSRVGASALGSGVEEVTVQRAHDPYLQLRMNAERSNGGSVTSQSRSLDAIQEVFNEQQGAGISDALAKLYSAFGELAASASGGATEREAVRAAAQRFVDAVHTADARLREEQSNANASVVEAVGEVNSLLDRIAGLNSRILAMESQAPANDLRDQRDGLLLELSEKIAVHSFEEGNGSVTLVTGGGHTLVERSVVHSLSALPDPTHPFDPGFARVAFDDGTGPVDITSDIDSGTLGGKLRVRDTLAADAIRELDVLAYNTAVTINAVHSAGHGRDGSTGSDFFAVGAGVEDAAQRLSLSAAVAASTDAIAAGASGSDPGDNGNALALASLRDQAFALHLPGDAPGSPSGPTRTMLGHIAVIVGDAGMQAKSFQAAVAQHEHIFEVLENQRDEASGVSIDEEVTRLIQLQAAFQANARVISTVQQMLEELVNVI
jgi:flagellar hook-associated protein 1 FlgK